MLRERAMTQYRTEAGRYHRRDAKTRRAQKSSPLSFQRDYRARIIPGRYTGGVNRRTFLAGSAAVALPAKPQTPRFIKGICSVIFPREMPLAEKFRQVKNAGFEAIEVRFGDEISPSLGADEVKRIGDNAHDAGIQIASMWMGGAFRTNPLNSPDPAVRARSLAGLKQGIECARHLNC